MHVAIGSDHAGYELKEKMKEMLTAAGHEVMDCGTESEESCDYPDIAEPLSQYVLARHILGILICGTGIGICIAANKIPGIRAALCQNSYTARLSRQHNDANILTIGARVTGPGLAEDIINTFISTEYLAGRHQRRVDKIHQIEKKYCK